MGTAIANQFTFSKASFARERGVIAAVGAGTFVFAFQVAALLVALPSMAAFLRPPFSTQWAVTTYLLFLSTLLVFFGSIGDLLGSRRVYLAGLIAFTAASFFCALANTPSLFLLGRAVQGIGAALSAANSPAILTRNIPAEHRGRALGWQAAMTYLGLAIGPTIGAYAVAHFEWRAVFLVEIPVGLIAIFLGTCAIPKDSRAASSKARIHISEVFFWIACITPLLFALGRGAEWGWRSPRIIFLLLVSLIGFVSFARAARRNADSLIDLSLFDSRGFSIAVFAEFLFYLALYAIGFLAPILVIHGRGMAAAWAGVLFTIQSVLRMVVAPMSGIASDRYGTRAVVSTGTLLFLFGIFSFLCMSNTGPILGLAVAAAFIGLGTGAFVPANSSRLLSLAPVRRHGMASGILATARNLGMMFGVAVAAAAYYHSSASGGTEEILAGIRSGLSIALLAAAVTLFAVWVPENGSVRSGLLRNSTLP